MELTWPAAERRSYRLLMLLLLPLGAQVRWETFEDFLSRVPLPVLRHKFCDLGLTCTLRKMETRQTGSVRLFNPVGDRSEDRSDFVYWYGHTFARDSASRHVEVSCRIAPG